MSIPNFIREHRDDLIEDWIRYARERQPLGEISQTINFATPARRS